MTGIHQPSREEVLEKAEAFDLSLNDDDLQYVTEFVAAFAGTFERLDELGEPSRRFDHTERDPGYRPGPEEDPLNAFVTKCDVPGASSGPIAGYSVGIKDNVAVAGVEATAGSTILDGYVPRRDATVTTRLLDAGATVTGKTTMLPFAYFSDDTWRTATGIVRNPHDPDRVASGSSAGSAVAVVEGEVDVAIGTDQGGSIRMPASWCGCVGLKPTYGLVPYSGIQSIANPIDHAGPMARTVEDCAKTLAVIAGEDGRDPRQAIVDVDVRDYVEALNEDVENLEVGVLRQAFDSTVDDEVSDLVRSEIDRFRDLGASVTDVSIPWAENGDPIFNELILEGYAETIRTNGIDYAARTVHDAAFFQEFGKARTAKADDFSLPLKATMLLGAYLADDYHGRYYAKAIDLAETLTEVYDDAFETVDVLALPSTQTTAVEMTEGTPVPDISEFDDRFNLTAHFNVTGHPAISVPCGKLDGLPVGLQLVGPRFRDDVVLRAAAAYESVSDYGEE